MAKPIAIAIIIATTPATMYISNGGKVLTGFGDGVGAVRSTTNDVIARDGQYDSEPAKEAYTMYCPSMSGFQLKV